MIQDLMGSKLNHLLSIKTKYNRMNRKLLFASNILEKIMNPH